MCATLYVVYELSLYLGYVSHVQVSFQNEKAK